MEQVIYSFWVKN